MRNTKIKIIFTAFTLFSTLGVATSANAAPMLFFQLAQTAVVEPSKGSVGCFEKCLVNNDLSATDKILNEDFPAVTDDDKKQTAPQDRRVITETNAEIVEDDTCECADVVVIPPIGFPFAYLALPLPALLLAGIVASDEPDDPEVISPIRP